MTTAREFLAKNKLAIAGARGKFSKPALEFLNKAIAEGQTFSDWDANGRIKPVHVKRTPKTIVTSHKRVNLAAKPTVVRLREENALQVLDDRGTIINIGQCSQGHTITRCTCSTITPPAYLKAHQWEIVKL
jgi:hypothetical protein